MQFLYQARVLSERGMSVHVVPSQVINVQQNADDYLHRDDYVLFLQRFIQSFNVPTAYPQLQFFAASGANFIGMLYGQREEIFPTHEWGKVGTLFHRYRYLFECVSLETIEKLLSEVANGRIIQDASEVEDALYINATGITNGVPKFLLPLVNAGNIEIFPTAKSGMLIHDPHIIYFGGLSLKSVIRSAETNIATWLAL